MQAGNIDHMFHGLTFQKSADHIGQACRGKIQQLQGKIEERQARINKVRAEFGIDDGAMIELLEAVRKNNKAAVYSYTSNASRGGGRSEEKTIGAGTINNLLTERDFIEAEKDQIERLDLIAQNINPLSKHSDGDGSSYMQTVFELTLEELRYLGF